MKNPLPDKQRKKLEREAKKIADSLENPQTVNAKAIKAQLAATVARELRKKLEKSLQSDAKAQKHSTQSTAQGSAQGESSKGTITGGAHTGPKGGLVGPAVNAALTRVRASQARKLFIDSMRRMPNIRIACESAGVSRKAALAWREKYPEFARKWDEAKEEAIDLLEAQCWMRAGQGTKKPIFMRDAKNNPVMVAEVPEYSDKMAELLLRAHRPSKYTKNVDVTSNGQTLSAPVSVPAQVSIILPSNNRDSASGAKVITINEANNEKQKQISQSSDSKNSEADRESSKD